MRTTAKLAFTALLCLAALPAFAADDHGLPGAAMSLWWGLPFVGLSAALVAQVVGPAG